MSKLVDSNLVAEFTSCRRLAEGNRRALGFDRPLLSIKMDQAMSPSRRRTEAMGTPGLPAHYLDGSKV